MHIIISTLLSLEHNSIEARNLQFLKQVIFRRYLCETDQNKMSYSITGTL